MKEEGECFQGFQEQLLLMQQFQQTPDGVGGFVFPDHVSPMMFSPPWTAATTTTVLPQVHNEYASFFNRRNYNNSNNNASSLQFPYEIGNNNLGQMGQVGMSGNSVPFGLQAELTKMTAQEIMDAKALAASRSHSEAERRRRERINNHLAKLRSLLPSTTKTDKASLLAEVIQHVKELKRQTTLIADVSPVPTELDELSVDVDASDEDGKFVIKASLCCEDRSDLLPQIIKTLKSLRLRTLKAEITTLGGRMKNVLFITSDDDCYSSSSSSSGDVQQDQGPQRQQQYSISSIQEALKAVMEKVCSSEEQTSSGSIKRQRTNTS